eukprot:TRINITY_DN4215_c0_g2_i1.p1 TRINITY_DN4215_c0_g2~~TRINITY_DN4215_c0_g2_i1.p1  ORF type:complete len:325 (+),score=49.65 TRINITY_DN4215_c0_g2_i1:86-1060(+)
MSHSCKSAKVLLMGRARAGKTSMRSIIFANYHPRDTNGLHKTNHVDHLALQFLGNLKLDLWDCGGQDNFMENYFDSQRETIFQNVEVLIYVIAVKRNSVQGPKAAGSEMRSDLAYFVNAMESLRLFSPNARVFALIHKLDLVHESRRDEVFRKFEHDLTEVVVPEIKHLTCMPTSIWDETLFKAWSSIVHDLVPGVNELEEQLEVVCQACEADEVVLFESSTFLLISHSMRKVMLDSHRFEKISNIVKQFKLCCNKIVRTDFKALHLKNKHFSAAFEPFLQHSFVMIVVTDPSVTDAAIALNLRSARSHFAELVKQGAPFGPHL